MVSLDVQYSMQNTLQLLISSLHNHPASTLVHPKPESPQETKHKFVESKNIAKNHSLQKVPSCVVCGKGWSRLSDVGSCAGGREIRFCHFGIGRSCCRLGRTAYPVKPRKGLISISSSNMDVKRLLFGLGSMVFRRAG